MKPRAIISIVLAVALTASLVAVQMQVDKARAEMARQPSMLYLSSGKWVKRMAFGYDGLLACLYWTRAVQHYGRENLGLQRYNLLNDLLDITTTLDPDLVLAYRFGAVFLALPHPAGPGRPDQAIQLLEKGIQHSPDEWRYRFDLGFVYFTYPEDYQRAGEVFHRAADLPGAPEWLRVLATSVATRGSDRETAMLVWRQLYESTDDPSLRGAALVHLTGLRAEADVEALGEIVSRYRAQFGRPPRNWGDLAGAGLLRGVPADPAGFPYVLGSEGNILINKDSTLINPKLRRAE